MKNNILFILKIVIVILLIQITYLFENTKIYFIVPILLICFFVVITKRTNKSQVDNYAKILIALLVVIFSIYNIINCIKLIKSSNTANIFIEEIKINNNNDYYSLLNKYKNLYNLQKGKDLEDEYKEQFELDLDKYSSDSKNSIFAYTKTINYLKGLKGLTEQALVSISFRNINKVKDNINDNIKFINTMEENFKYINNVQRKITISLIMNIVLVNLTTIFYIKKYTILVK